MVKPAPYAVGQTVEVYVTDFSTEGFPKAWKAGTVVAVEPIGTRGRWDVNVQTGEREWSPQIVGPRGGNPNIRPVAA